MTKQVINLLVQRKKKKKKKERRKKVRKDFFFMELEASFLSIEELDKGNPKIPAPIFKVSLIKSLSVFLIHGKD